jgi:hypothetical protein
MELTSIIVVLIVTGVILLMINRLIPLPPTARKVLNALVMVAVILWLLRVIVILLS